MTFIIPVELSIDVPNDVQAKILRDDLRRLLTGPMGKAFLEARGVRGVDVGQPAPKR